MHCEAVLYIKGGIARGCKIKLCIVGCLYELWALWVLSIWFGVTMLCGSDFSVVYFMTVIFRYTVREIYGLWNMSSHCRACLDIMVYTWQSVHCGIYYELMG